MLFTTRRLNLIKSVLTVIAIYHMLSLELPSWVLKAITKIFWSVLWRGHKESDGYHFLVAWE